MNDQAFKARPEIIDVNSNEPVLKLIFLVLKQVNVATIVIILMIHTQKYVFLML